MTVFDLLSSFYAIINLTYDLIEIVASEWLFLGMRQFPYNFSM